MKLTEIRIDNFRSITECRLHISEVTAVIGENNAGKTALLRALNSVFNWEYEQAYFLNNAHQYAVRTTTKIVLIFEAIPDREIYANKLLGNKLFLELKYAEALSFLQKLKNINSFATPCQKKKREGQY